MRRAFVCPSCKDRNVTFSGVKDNLIMRATSDWVAGFVCGNFHTFFVLLADAAPPALITLLTFRGDKIIATHSSLSVVKEL